MRVNSDDGDQKPRNAASGVGLHCLPMSHKKDVMPIWVRCFNIQSNFLSLYVLQHLKTIFHVSRISDRKISSCLK